MENKAKTSIFKKGLKAVNQYAYRTVMKSGPSEFRYHEELPIKLPEETRFIELFSGKDEDDICIDLVCRDARTPAAFGALSYVWGSKADPVPIYIGKHRRQVVHVTRSLDAALRSMRRRLGKYGGSAFYWIDALCINQKDNAEKSQQIPLMPLIYPAAYLTYCWLGEADETTDKTFAIIGNCANYLKANDYQMAKVVLDVVIAELHSTDRSFVDGLQRLLRKPWFERAWILQESCRPIDDTPHLVCGHFQVQLIDLRRVVKYLQETLLHEERTILFQSADQAALNCLEVATTDRAAFTFSYLLETMALRKAENPRDKFYALLGLLANSDMIYPKPDYDAPLHKVSISYTRSIIANERSLSVLQSPRPSPDSVASESPSWCLDPTSLPGRRTISGFPRRPKSSALPRDFLTTGSSTPILPPQDLFDPVLCLHGHQMDTIVTVNSTQYISKRLSQATTSWKELIHTLHDSLVGQGLAASKLTLEEPFSTAVARVLTADQFFTLRTTQRAYDHDHFKEFYVSYRQKATRSRVPLGNAVEDKLVSESDLLAWCQAHLHFDKEELPSLQSTESVPVDFLGETAAGLFVRAILDLCLVTTASGRIGLAPCSTAQGDSIVLFPGATAPLVLRGRTAPVHGWGLLGELYLHGAMSGEAYDESKLQEFRVI